MSLPTSLISGFAGAAALNTVHETARHVLPHDAPRVDVTGKRALVALLRKIGIEPPTDPDELYRWTLASDLISNAAYYSLVGAGPRQHTLRRGLLLGFAAGVGAVALPPLMGLGHKPTGRSPAVQMLTIAWYTLGGAVAAGVQEAIGKD